MVCSRLAMLHRLQGSLVKCVKMNARGNYQNAREAGPGADGSKSTSRDHGYMLHSVFGKFLQRIVVHNDLGIGLVYQFFFVWHVVVTPPTLPACSAARFARGWKSAGRWSCTSGRGFQEGVKFHWVIFNVIMRLLASPTHVLSLRRSSSQ